MKNNSVKQKLILALNNPTWKKHSIGDVYLMDGKETEWKIAYYPIFSNGKTNTEYSEPRALVETPILNGIDFREIPLWYLTRKENG